MTLRCDGYHPLVLELRPISTLWYLGHLLLPSHGKSIEVQTPGVYRCQTRGAPVSDPIHLSVSNGECPCWAGGQHAPPLGGHGPLPSGQERGAILGPWSRQGDPKVPSRSCRSGRLTNVADGSETGSEEQRP